jgi:hypothetical protein
MNKGTDETPLLHGKATGTPPCPYGISYIVCYAGLLHMSNISFEHLFREKLMQKITLVFCTFDGFQICEYPIMFTYYHTPTNALIILISAFVGV